MEVEEMNPTRRWFVVRAPVAAAAGFILAHEALNPTPTAAQPALKSTIQTFTAARLQADFATLDSAPGNLKIIDVPTFVVMLTVEKNKGQEQFEWHEGRDHIFQILEGSTSYELGGTPKGAHSTGPGEWNAPESEHAEKVTVNQGDMLIIPRGTPHRRTTTGSVRLMLISPQGTV